MPEPEAGSAPRWKARLRTWAEAERLQRHENKLLLALTLLVGAGVGLVIVAFILLTEGLGSRLYPGTGAAWRRLAIPTLGALVTGWLLARYFPNARGSGIPQTKTALFLRNGTIRLRTVVGKFACSSASLASGIALGREGPAVQIGAGIASVLTRRLGFGRRTVKAFVPIGTAAALAAAFNTPISAVLFTLEEILDDLHAPVLGSIVISSVTSWAVLHLLLGDEPLFHVPPYQLVHPIELIVYAVLGVAGGLVSTAFVKLLLGLRRGFRRLPASTAWLHPAAGGLLVGVMGWFVPEVLGVGYTHVSEALNGQMVMGLMALLLVLKLVATAGCYASGNAGGIFGPSLFIGAMLGGGLGSVAHGWLPDVTGDPGAYALVGMGVAFAGIVRAPMTSVLMIFEITRDYSIIVPLMIANLLSYFVSQRLQPEPIYHALLHQDGVKLPPARPALALDMTASAAGDADAAPASARRFLLAVASALIGLLVLAGFVAFHYNASRATRAARFVAAGDVLSRQHRMTEAIEQYRSALSLNRSNRNRLMLADALVQAHQPAEARIYLEEVLAADAANGPACLSLARIAAREGNRASAAALYRRAVAGAFDAAHAGERGQAEDELRRLEGKTR